MFRCGDREYVQKTCERHAWKTADNVFAEFALEQKKAYQYYKRCALQELELSVREDTINFPTVNLIDKAHLCNGGKWAGLVEDRAE
jgi:hypothetical protein